MDSLSGYAAWMTVLIVAYVVLPSLRAESWGLIYGSAIAAMLIGVFRNHPSRKAPWLLLTAAALCFGAGQLALLSWAPHGNSVIPGLSVEDLSSLAKFPLFAGGLALFARARTPGGDREAMVDAATISLGLAMLIWVFRILPDLLDPNLSTTQKVIAIGFPVGDLLVVLALARLLAPGTVPRGSLLLLTAGTAAGVLSGILYGAVSIYADNQVVTIPHIGWSACFAACGAAALSPSMRELTEPPHRQLGRGSRVRVAILTVTTLIAPGLLCYIAANDEDPRDGTIAATAAVLYMLVLARLWTVNVSHRRALFRERGLRMAGTGLASAHSVAEIAATVEGTVTAFIADSSSRLRSSRFQTLFALRSGDTFQVVSPAADARPPVPASEVAKLAVTWLPRLRPLKTADPLFVPNNRLEPAERAAAKGAGYDGILLCPLVLTHRPSGDPLVGLLAVGGKQQVLRNLRSALGILASQVALAVERVTLTQELVRQRGEAVFRTLVQDASDVIIILDENLRIRYATPSAEKIFGYIPGAGTRVARMFADQERLSADPSLREPGAGTTGQFPAWQEPFSGLWRVRTRDERTLLVEIRYSDRRSDPTVEGHVLTMRDVTEQRQLEDELKHQVLHDSLTGLPNRVLFTDRAKHALEMAQRTQTAAAVLFVDLDDFKVINDTMGHGVGDELLIAVAGRLASVARASDTAARLGGDEFALLIENLADTSTAEVFADRVVAAFGEPFHLSTGTVLSTVTAGLATSEDSSDADQLLRHADLALYAAKSAGKRRWDRYVPMLSAGMVRRREMHSALEDAVAKSAFELAYQPIVTLGDGRVSGFEALLRWPHPTWGMLLPGQFIDLAEETGHIIPLGAWVIRQAITDLVRWRGPDPDPRQPFVSVNVTARQFRDLEFIRLVRGFLDESGLVPSALMLELTESGLLRRDERINADLAELKHTGVRLAIDDFGTGYSSLSYLREMPIDVLKIDKSFVEGVAASVQDLALVKGIVEIAHTLGIDVIAEGIETEEQRALMAEMGCRYGQGYLLARPMPWDQAQVLLRSSEGRVREFPPRRASFPGGMHTNPPRPPY